jgi:hypothetical protein
MKQLDRLIGQILRAVHVRRIDDGNRALTPMRRVLVFQDCPYILRRVANRPWQGASIEVWRFPSIHAWLTLKRRQQSIVCGDVGRDRDATLFVDAVHNLRQFLSPFGESAV